MPIVGDGDFYSAGPVIIKGGHVIGSALLKEGSNNSTLALRVVGGDENGSLESERVKYGHVCHGTRTRE
jgi:hypothetical protein